MPGMEAMIAESLRMLEAARIETERVLDGLLKRHAEMLASPPPLQADQLLAGREAAADAIASARRTLESLDAIRRRTDVSLH